MKVVILAGGFGTRLSEYTDRVPKPMVEIGGKPILWHIMSIFMQQGFHEFILALGYKAEVIKNYFLNYHTLNSDFSVNLGSGEIEIHDRGSADALVTLVDTGHSTMTGGRVLLLDEYLEDGPFLLTYGDGLANVDLNALLSFHRNHGKLATVTAVRPSARYGELDLEGPSVRSFEEKPQIREGWVNGGFFVLEREFLSLIADRDTVLEREPLERVSKMGELMAFRHDGFWQCMDAKRDKDLLNEMWKNGHVPWLR
jgi:glucose-1-phosphate cytidylyltransferase